MISDPGALLTKLNSPSDWAVALGAGVLGLVVDGAINIVPLPFFTPGICAGVAASASISLKRGVEAWLGTRRAHKHHAFLCEALYQLAGDMETAGDARGAKDLRLDVKLANGDEVVLRNLITEARAQLRNDSYSPGLVRSLLIPRAWPVGTLAGKE